jgi:hypothetical protein
MNAHACSDQAPFEHAPHSVRGGAPNAAQRVGDMGCRAENIEA